VKALSIRQPWAWLIVNGHKPLENRTWTTPCPRGPLLIHAGKSMTRAEWASCELTVRAIAPHVALPSLEALQHQLGGIVGRCTLSGWVHEHPSPWFFGPYAFTLEDARPLPFTPCRGALGFFDVEEWRE
jgi:hypothetical protein